MRDDSKDSLRGEGDGLSPAIDSLPLRPVFAANAGQALVLCLVLSISGWLVDLCALGLDEGLGALFSRPRGIFAAFFLSGVFGLVVGALVGFFWAVALGRQRGEEWLAQKRKAIRAYLWEGDPDEHLVRLISYKALLLSALVFAYLSYRLSYHFVLEFAQPHFIAFAIVGVHLALILLCLPIFNVIRGILLEVTRLFPGGRPILAVRLGSALILSMSVFSLVSIYLIVHFWSVLSFLPWAFFIRVILMLVLGVLVANWFSRRRRPGFKASTRWSFFLVLWFGCGFAGIGIPHEAQLDRAVFEDHVFVASQGRAIVGRLTDLDGDGFQPFFGGGDCAALDVAVHPGAVDIPENGIDEDCYGGDLTMDVLSGAVNTTRHRVPGAFPSRPNIILITIDAFSAKHLKSMGYPTGVTPNLDRLASGGILFENCFSQGPSTRLSIPAMFTSRWDSEIERELVGKHPYPLLEENEMMAEVLKKSGYSTHAVIPAKYFSKRKWKGLHQGFEHVHERPARFWNKRNRPHNAHRVTDAAIKVLKKKKKKPLFLWAHYYDAHTPHKWPQGVKHRGSTKEWIYNGELEFVDRHVGRLLEEIDKSLDENTVIIVTSDHGHGFDKPRHRKHGYGYDLNTVTLHVPLIITGPGLKARRVPSMVSTLDILPTVTNLLGIAAKLEVRGSSLVPELFGQPGTRPQVLFHQYFLQEKMWQDKAPLQMVGLRTPKYNLVLDRKKGRTYLWNWRKDYFEKENLIGSEDPEIRVEEAKLRQLLSAFLFKTGAGQRSKVEEPVDTPEGPEEPREARPRELVPALTPALRDRVMGPPVPSVPSVLRGAERPPESVRRDGADR